MRLEGSLDTSLDLPGSTCSQYMSESHTQDRVSVYEIGYILAGLPEEKVAGEASSIESLITKGGATIVKSESPKYERLAYTMRKKTVSGSYEKYDDGYFGWVKFEVAPSAINAIQKAVETTPRVLRALVITTVKEDTYLGKRASSTDLSKKGEVVIDGGVVSGDKKEAAPASIEDMDKSIDEMVKEA